MLAFIISKMDLLILVTALFAIIAFFAFGRCDAACNSQARESLNELTERATSILNSTASCQETVLTLPNYFPCNCSGDDRIFYRMVISRLDSTDPDDPHTLVFTIFNRKTNKVMASRSAQTNSEVLLYYWNRSSGALEFNPTGATGNLLNDGYETAGGRIKNLLLDPQGKPVNGIDPVNEAVIIKELFNNREYVHVIPCAVTSSNSCINNKQKVAQILQSTDVGSRSAGSSRCFSTVS